MAVFDANSVLKALNDDWSWTGHDFSNVEEVSDFGCLIVVTTDDVVCWVAPDFLYCDVISTESAKFELSGELAEDFWCKEVLQFAQETLGPLAEGEVYAYAPPPCMTNASLFENLMRMPLAAYLRVSGQLARQVSQDP